MSQAEIKNMPGLKESDLAPCALCGKHHEAPVFYRVTVESCAFDTAAVRRQVGLGMTVGSAALASVLGPNEDMAKVVSSERKTLCLECAMSALIAQVI